MAPLPTAQRAPPPPRLAGGSLGSIGSLAVGKARGASSSSQRGQQGDLGQPDRLTVNSPLQFTAPRSSSTRAGTHLAQSTLSLYENQGKSSPCGSSNPSPLSCSCSHTEAPGLGPQGPWILTQSFAQGHVPGRGGGEAAPGGRGGTWAQRQPPHFLPGTSPGLGLPLPSQPFHSKFLLPKAGAGGGGAPACLLTSHPHPSPLLIPSWLSSLFSTHLSS